ncbi:MAG: hypothetical protein QF554_07400 [Dehalococcoidia bacterium]|nr:hypothetical protein [Dehalococcoidia bacterium]
MFTRRYIMFMAVAVAALVALACSSGADEPSDSSNGSDSGTSRESGSRSEDSSGPGSDDSADSTSDAADTPTPQPEFSGYSLDLSEGDFWEYRWSYVDGACIRFSCSSDKDDGVFQVTLGGQREIEGVPVYALQVTGKSAVDISGENREFAPRWDYLGVDGDRLVVSNGSRLTTLFDAGTGKWAGSGYFTTRFNEKELVSAGTSSLSSGLEIAGWPGVAPGAWQYVGRSDSQSQCEIIAGERICPNEDTFSYTENEYYRAGIGPVAYQFRNSVSFDGMENTFSTTEWVALVASSLRGDAAAPTPTPVPPSPTPVPPPEPPDTSGLLPLFGPVDGNLRLDPRSRQIPDFSSGLSLDRAIVQVEFTNPDISGGRWSHGITFRQSEEEVFHAVYFTGIGDWGHFVRTGTLASEIDLDSGTVPNNRTSGAANVLTLVFDRTEGQLFLNDEFVADLDLSAPGALGPGDIRVMSGLLASDFLDGSQSAYSGFSVFPLR